MTVVLQTIQHLTHCAVFICFCLMFILLYRKLGFKGFIVLCLAFFLMTLMYINDTLLGMYGLKCLEGQNKQYFSSLITFIQLAGFVVLLIELFSIKKKQDKNPYDPSPKIVDEEAANQK